MAPARQRFRHLPPSAVPVFKADLQAGLRASPAAQETFRQALAAYFDLPPAACYLASSGRTGIYLLLRGLAAEHSRRQQVVMPAYTCPVLPKVALDLGLEPVYVDIEPETAHYERARLAAAIGDQTLAVILVHPFGISQPASDIVAAARDAGAAVIEDAAQAMGARWAGRPVGLAGDYGLFSLGPGKPLSTAGGGIVIAGEAHHARQLARWWSDLPPAGSLDSTFAWLRQADFRLAFHPLGWWAATRLGMQRLGNQEAGWGYTVRDLSSAQAGVGAALLPRLDAINARRREIALRLIPAIEKANSLNPPAIQPDAEAIFLRLPLLATNEEQREALYKKMWAAGIGAGRMYEKTLPAIFQTAGRATYPGAEDFARRLLTLPTHYHVTQDDIEIMRQILAGF
jgi:dTDP-4-amino-4,6-dideoxygalactose transaminase